jgi:hypothetical protein
LTIIEHENFTAMLAAPAPDWDAVGVKLQALKRWLGRDAQEAPWLQAVIADVQRLNGGADQTTALDLPLR